MDDVTNPPFWKDLIKALSKVLLVVGAIVFLLADRFLREVLHFNFWLAEAIGLGSGVFIATFGWLLRKAAESGD